MSVIKGMWAEELYSEFTKPYYKELYNSCRESKSGSPQPATVFNTLATVPLEDTSVVILYDICEDCHLQAEKLKHMNFDLFRALANVDEAQQFYSKQDVLLYNISQFYVQGNLFYRTPMSFYKFANAVVTTLARQDRPLVVLLLGNSVYKYKGYFYNPKHLILSAPLSSSTIQVRGSNQTIGDSKVQAFGGQSILQKCNRFLINNNLRPIQWSCTEV